MRRVFPLLLVGMLAATLATAVFAVDSPAPAPVTIVVEGIITNVTIVGPSTGKITLQVPSATSTSPVRLVTFAVNERTKLYRDGVPVTLADAKVGDGCRAMLLRTSAGDLVALVVYLKTPPPPPIKWVAGVIVEKAYWNNIPTFKMRASNSPVLLWFSVDDKTRITVNGLPAGYGQLAKGQRAEVRYVQPPPSPLTVILPILASVVNAKSPVPPPGIHLTGRLAFIDFGRSVIGVQLPTGSIPVQVKITPTTIIDKFGPAPLRALIPNNSACPGDMVDVLAKPVITAEVGALPLALSVKALPETIAGTVAAVDPVGRKLLLIPTNAITPAVIIDPGPGITFRTDSRTRITRNGRVVTLERLIRGDLANIRYFRFRDADTAPYYNLAAAIDARGVTPIVGAPAKKR